MNWGDKGIVFGAGEAARNWEPKIPERRDREVSLTLSTDFSFKVFAQ